MSQQPKSMLSLGSVCIICGLLSCTSRTDTSVFRKHHSAILEGALRTYVRSGSRIPTADSINQFLDEEYPFAQFDREGARSLDTPELLLLMVSGMPSYDEVHGWRFVQDGRNHLPFFQPSEEYVADIDSDGWPEYLVPGLRGVVYGYSPEGDLVRINLDNSIETGLEK